MTITKEQILACRSLTKLLAPADADCGLCTDCAGCTYLVHNIQLTEAEWNQLHGR
jgi:hypothetical protein